MQLALLLSSRATALLMGSRRGTVSTAVSLQSRLRGAIEQLVAPARTACTKLTIRIAREPFRRNGRYVRTSIAASTQFVAYHTEDGVTKTIRHLALCRAEPTISDYAEQSYEAPEPMSARASCKRRVSNMIKHAGRAALPGKCSY